MGDFSTRQPAPGSTGGEVSRDPRDQGGASPTGFADAPVGADEQGNFAAGPGVRPGGTKIH